MSVIKSRAECKCTFEKETKFSHIQYSVAILNACDFTPENYYIIRPSEKFQFCSLFFIAAIQVSFAMY